MFQTLSTNVTVSIQHSVGPNLTRELLSESRWLQVTAVGTSRVIVAAAVAGKALQLSEFERQRNR